MEVRAQPREFITKAETARRIGVSGATIRRLVEAGTLSLTDGGMMVWPDVSAEYDAYRENWKGKGRPPQPRMPYPRPGYTPKKPPPPPKPPAPEEDPDAYAINRAKKVGLEADRLELQVAKLRGELVAAADVRRMVSEPLARVDTRIRNIPMRFGPELARKAGIDQVEAMGILDDIVDELRAALRSVGQYTPGDPVPGMPGLEGPPMRDAG